MSPDPLAGLRGWHLPKPVSWWPPAPGWWLLLALVLAVAAVLLVWAYRHRRRTAAGRAARRQLEALEKGFAADRDSRRYIAELSRLLRRLALVRYPRERVAGLSGRDWLAFLDTTGGSGGFSGGVGTLLVSEAYRPEGAVESAGEVAELHRLVARWIDANGGGRS